MARLRDLATVITKGTTPTSLGFAFQNEGINFVKIESVDDNGNFIFEKFDHISDGCHEKLKRSQLQENDILFSIAGAIGRTAIVTKDILPANTNQALAIIRIPEGVINYSFLLYILQSSAVIEQTEKKKQGVAQLNLSLKDIGDFIIPDIPLEQQKIIVETLDKVNNVISLRKQQLSKLDELVKCRFIEMFGDGRDGKTPVRMLGGICKFQQGTQIPVDEQFEEQKSGYKRFLRIIDYTQAPQPPRFVNVNGKEVDEKSVVIVRYGATAGFVGRGYQGILANNLFEIMPDETILSKDFLFLALKYGTFEKEVHDMAFGAAMPALSFSMMNDIPVVVPMPEQQQQFVSFVEQVDKSKFEIQKSLEKLETLKKALMQKYFG